MNSEVFRSASTSVVFPAPDGAESTKRIPLRVKRLLKVLNLFSDFLELGLAGDNPLRNSCVVRFGAERVQLSENLLGDEFQSSANRFVASQMMGKLGQVALGPGQFFRNIGPVGKKRDLFEQAFVVTGDRQTGFLNSVQQGGPVFLYHLGM